MVEWKGEGEMPTAERAVFITKLKIHRPFQTEELIATHTYIRPLGISTMSMENQFLLGMGHAIVIPLVPEKTPLFFHLTPAKFCDRKENI